MYFGTFMLVVSCATLCQASGTETERPRHRGLDLLKFFPRWVDIKSLHDFKDDMHDVKEVKDFPEFKDLPGFGDFKDFPDLKDLLDFKDPHAFGKFRPDVTYSFQRIPNQGKDMEEGATKAEVDFDYHGDYDYDYYQDEDDYETQENDEDDPSDGDYYDLSSLSFMDKEHLKNVGSVEEVARITGFPLLQEIQNFAPERDQSFSSSLRVRSGQRRNSYRGPSIAQRATCEPEKVSIPVEASAGYRVIPSCTRVKKCGGCCNPGLECVATKTKELDLKVLELSLVNDSMRWKVLENVTEDVECGCQCAVKKGDCLPTQDYDRDTCSCICKPSLESVRKECEENGRLWDPYQCQCQCPMHTPRSVADCGSGQKFNSLACSCEND